MPRLYPPDPPLRDAGAERVLWEALRDQLPDDVVLFADVGLQDDDVEREIDLLVAWPGVGLAAIEVKGGHVGRQEGEWWQGSGRDRHRIDPVHQVQQARHVLSRLLAQHRLDAGRARIVHLVALPHTSVGRDWDSAEIPRAMLLDRGDLGVAASLVKAAIELHGKGHGPLADDGVEPLVRYLTSAFPSQIEILALAAAHEDHLDQLTRDQVRVLDLFRQFDRLQVLGGAGTGKTWLALEQARRRTRDGERVALLCYSRGLGRYLQRITASWPQRERPAYVGLFHDLALEWGAPPGTTDDSAYWECELPLALGRLADERPPADHFDSVVVDEAQDFGELWWVSLLRCLRDPVAGGLFVFLDRGQRVFGRDGAVPIEAPPVTLDENLRSTKQIAQLCGSLRDDVVKPPGRRHVRRGDRGSRRRRGGAPRAGVGAGADRAADHRPAACAAGRGRRPSRVRRLLGRLPARGRRLLRARPRVQGARAHRRRARRQRVPGHRARADDALHGYVTGADPAGGRRAAR